MDLLRVLFSKKFRRFIAIKNTLEIIDRHFISEKKLIEIYDNTYIENQRVAA